MISARNLTKFYGEKCAVEDLSFDIARGEIVGILGLNGAGKTTTLHILASLLLPSSGTITLNGIDVAEEPHEARKLVGFLPEYPPLYGEMTVSGFLRFCGQLRGLSAARTTDRLKAVAALTHLEDVVNDPISSLSHGFRQRVGIAQAIIHEPPVVILDEPIKGLDPVQIVEMRQLIRNLRGQHTVLLSSHILPEISQTCDRILVIQAGRLVAAGREDELTTHLTHRRRVHVTIKGQRVAIVEALGQLEHVKHCVEVASPMPWPGSSAAADIYNFELELDADARADISHAIVTRGFGLLQLSPAEGELESIFLSLTTQQEPSAASGASEKE